MELKIFNSTINYIPIDNEIVLTEKDFHPCNPFFIDHPSLLPESFIKITTKGVLETTRYLRHTFKVIDALLAVDGEIYIEFFRASFDSGGFPLRPYNFMMNELSICFGERYKVYKKHFDGTVDYFWLKKIESTLPNNDTISRWSFGIVSNGSKNNRVLSIINQIISFQIPEFEILICGPKPSENLPELVKIIIDSELYFDARIPISKKKNKIIDSASFNNLVIMHDRISFNDDWYQKIYKYGNHFDQLCMPILDEVTRSLRINDWIAIDHDLTEYAKTKSFILNYKDWSPFIYVDGGFMLVKKHIISQTKLKPFLNWGEMEDVNLSQRLYLDGNSITFYTGAVLFTETHRIKANKPTINWFKKIIRQLRNKQYLNKRNIALLNSFYIFLKSKN
jgi:hypothetical protein